MDVGERLQSIRKLKGLSQRELAKRAGVTNSTISMIEKNSVSPSISSLRKVLGGIPMSMVEFFSEEILQEKPTQIVYKANELIDISDGAVTMKLVGRAHPSRAIAFLNEIYPPGADTGEEMLTHDGEETGILLEGRLELVVGVETFVLEAGDTVLLTENLNVKGANFIAPKGTKVPKIRLVPDNAEQIEGKIEGSTIVILTKYVRKSN